jgi:hypothetical protein
MPVTNNLAALWTDLIQLQPARAAAVFPSDACVLRFVPATGKSPTGNPHPLTHHKPTFRLCQSRTCRFNIVTRKEESL